MFNLQIHRWTCAYFLAFALRLHGQTVIFNSSPSANAGDAIYLQGSGFGSNPVVQYSYNDSNWKNFAATAASHDTVTVKIPASERNLPDLLTVRVSPDGVNWSQPAYINRTRAISFDTPQVSPGGVFRIFGRNLYFARTPTVRFVDQADGSQYTGWVNASLSTDYSLVAVAPWGISVGHSYAVYVSNSYNGTAASGSETLAGQTLICASGGQDYWGLGVPWAPDFNFYGNVYNVKTDPRLSNHAYGYGWPSDINAINEAIIRANQDGGGVVLLPAGVYSFVFSNGCGVTLLPRVVLMGEGQNLTSIYYGWGPAPSDGGYAVCFGASQSGISDLTLINVNQSGQWPQSGAGPGGSELFIQRVNWNMSTSQWISFQQTNRLVIENSTFTQYVDSLFNYNGIFNLSGISYFLVKGNQINFSDGGINMVYANNGVFEDNAVVRDASAPLPPDNITHVIPASFANNFFILNNSFSVANGILPTTNNGETIETEAGGANRSDEFRGVVTSANLYSVTDSNQNFYQSYNAIPSIQAGASVAIVSGPGTGQWRNVVAVTPDGHTLFVDQPWLVAPTNASHYATFDWSTNWIIAGNSMSGNEKGIEFFNASVKDVLISSNTLTDNSGVLFSPEQNPGGLFNVIANVEIRNNSISDNAGLRPAYIGLVPREDSQSSNFGAAIIGMEVRGNNIMARTANTVLANTQLDDSKATAEGYNSYWQWQTIYPPFQDLDIPATLGMVFQSNTAVNSSSAFTLNSAIYETVLQDTVTRNVPLFNTDSVVPGATHGSIATTVNGDWAYSAVGNVYEPQNSVQTAYSLVTGTSINIAPGNSAVANGGDYLGLVSQQLTNDVSAKARIAIPGSADSSVAGAVTMRDSNDASSPFVSVGPIYQGQQIALFWRDAFGAGIQSKFISSPVASPWLMLAKSGNTFDAFWSAEGIFWKWMARVGSSFSGNPYQAGIFATSSGAQPGMTVTFDQIDVEPN